MMNTTAAPVADSTDTGPGGRSGRPRVAALDALRGAAVALMVLDHALIVTGHADSPVRFTVTRLAMPLFAVLVGNLVRRLGWRWVDVAAVGVLLPMVVPWIDGRPNILVWLAAGAVVVVAFRDRAPWALWLAVLLPLVAFANGLLPHGPSSYEGLAVVGLVCAGALIPRHALVRIGAYLPRHLGVLGRFPLSVYVGHLLAFELVRVLWFQ